MVKVVPAILTDNNFELAKLLKTCEGVVDRVQIDIIDGVFATNKTVDLAVFEKIETDLNLDFHLMVKNPVNWVEKCIRAGADRIIGQIEMMESQTDFIGKVQEVAGKVGLAIDLKTPVESIDANLLGSLDAVLVMSVPAGHGGQEFDQKALLKIKKLAEIRDVIHAPYNIIDDGGITQSTIDEAKDAGVDEVAVGRRIFDGDLKENIERFVKASYKNI